MSKFENRPEKNEAQIAQPQAGHDNFASLRTERGDNLTQAQAEKSGEAVANQKGLIEATGNAAKHLDTLARNGEPVDQHLANFITAKPGTEEHKIQSAVVAMAQGKFNMSDLVKQA